MTERQETRCKQQLDDLKKRIEYWKLKQEALNRTVWRTGFGGGCAPVVWQTEGWMDGWTDGRMLFHCVTRVTLDQQSVTRARNIRHR